MAAAATPLCLTGLDAAFGADATTPRTDHGSALRWLPRIYILLQLLATGWAVLLAIRPSTTPLEFSGLALSAGVTTGVFGFVAAHEMIHSRDRRDRALGLVLLGTVLYMHFRIAHVHGHHARAATREDPASARLGEGLYAFLVRSVGGQLREAFAYEAQRRRRKGLRAFGAGNRALAYVVLEGLLLLGLAIVSWRALVFALAVAGIAIGLLESFNYVAHYGLTRRTERNGRLERLGPHHSWNSARRMNNAALFNMGRHSDHHRHSARPYGELEPLIGSAELPSGYAAALLLALVPPLWRRTMDARAKSVLAARPLV